VRTKTSWIRSLGQPASDIVRKANCSAIYCRYIAGGGRALVAHRIAETGEYLGVSQIPEIASRSLSATDLDGLELIPEQFRIHLRASLGIVDGGMIWSGQDFLELGVLQVGDQRLFLTYALRQPSAGYGARLRAHAQGALPVMLLPTQRQCASELAMVTLDTPLP
jgi:hypothetical protein